MKSVFYLIKREVIFLGGTVALIGVILAIFCAAFLSVVSVALDVPEGFFNYADSNLNYMHIISVAVPDCTLGEASALHGEWVYGTKSGLTTDCYVEFPNGKQMPQNIAEGKNEPFAYYQQDSDRAFAVMPNCEVFNEQIGSILVSGKTFDAPNQLITTTSRQKNYNLQLGQIAKIGDREFEIVGFMDSATIWNFSAQERRIPICGAYFSVAEDEKLDFCYLGSDGFRSTLQTINDLQSKQIPYFTAVTTSAILSNVNLCRSFFGTIAFVLAIMVLFIVYSLIAMFYRQRRVQICRFRLLGASGSTVAWVYCLIALILGFVAVAVGAVGSIAFNKFFMGLCSDLFGMEFASHFYVAIPFAAYAAMALFVVALYGVYCRRINNAKIAEEVRHE